LTPEHGDSFRDETRRTETPHSEGKWSGGQHGGDRRHWEMAIGVGSDPCGNGGGQWVIGSAGKRPLLRNGWADKVATFRKQVTVVDPIGYTDPAAVAGRGVDLAVAAVPALAACGCMPCSTPTRRPADRL